MNKRPGQVPPQEMTEQAGQQINRVEMVTGQTLGEANTTLEMLRTQADRARGLMALFGFGRRILVPPDEIHVVVGDGRHAFFPSRKSRVFGQTIDRPSTYWLTRLTQVIKLKTISFTVTIRGEAGQGVPALDSSKVSFQIWAHAVAKLNPEKAEIAAQRVGLDATSLINTITEVGTAELVAAAATMTLEEIIANRQQLAAIAFPQVNQILSELGYDLALLTITNLDGMAYRKLVEQAEARISKETSIVTNREQVAELQDRQGRAQREAEIRAMTEKKLAAERLEAEREVEMATLGQQESLAVRRHEVELLKIDRDKNAAHASHDADLAKVQLTRQLNEAEVEKEAQLARLREERAAELRAVQQQRTAEIRLAETEADARRLAAEQARKIERDAERTLAEAKRLEQEELAAAERLKDVTVVQADAEAHAMRIKVDAETKAELVHAEADTKAELIRAEAEANATEKRAQAAKIRAEATRAEAAAPGLAEAEVAEKQVAVMRAEGLAQAEIAEAQAKAEADRLQRIKEVEIEAQRELMSLYDQAPVLVELERLRMQMEHEERLTQLQLESSLKAFEAIAPGIKVHIYGSGGQMSQIITDLLSLSRGVYVLGEEVPAVGRLLEARPTGAEVRWGTHLLPFMPYVRQVLDGINPRLFASLKVADVVERLGPVVAGHEDLATALESLRNDGNFRVVGDLPIAPLLKLFGIDLSAARTAAPSTVAGSTVELQPESEILH